MRTRQYRGIKTVGFILLCFGFWSTSSQALRFGNQSQINPFLEVQGTYDSNIFRVSNDSDDNESDFMTVVSPGIHLELPTAEDSPYRLLGNYRANIKFYGASGDAAIDPNDELNTVEQRLDGQFKLSLASGLNFSTGYVLNLSSNPPDNPQDTRKEYTEHNLSTQIGYRFVDRYEVQAEYKGTFKSFEDIDFESDDVTTHRIDGTFFYRLFSSLWILGGGGYGLIDRDDLFFSDSTEYRGFGGVRFDVTERVTGQIRAGMISKNYDDEAIDDHTDVFINGEILSEMFESTKVSLFVQRELLEGSQSDDITNPYYVSTRFGASLKHVLTAVPNLSFAGSLELQWKDFPDDVDDRSDSIFEVGVGAEYKLLKFLSLGVNYKHNQNDSNLNENDYGVDTITGLLRILL